jgi:hypothetical protein
LSSEFLLMEQRPIEIKQAPYARLRPIHWLSVWGSIAAGCGRASSPIRSLPESGSRRVARGAMGRDAQLSLPALERAMNHPGRAVSGGGGALRTET